MGHGREWSLSGGNAGAHGFEVAIFTQGLVGFSYCCLHLNGGNDIPGKQSLALMILRHQR